MNTGIRNNPITHLAMPERQIPVLVASTSERAEGFVELASSIGKSPTKVRRLDLGYVTDLHKNERKRKELETEFGAFGLAEWADLRHLLKLRDRVNAGDWSTVTSTDAVEKFVSGVEFVRSLIESGNFKPDKYEVIESGLGFRMDSVDGASCEVAVQDRSNSEIDGEFNDDDLILEETYQAQFEPVTVRTRIGKLSELDSFHLVLRPNVETKLVVRNRINDFNERVELALSRAFTTGMSKARFVVWWHEAAQKLVPGLYCPDIVTALYALAMWSSGTAGGWAICQKCNKDYPRSRPKQDYCSEKCRAAAAMQRRRNKLKLKLKSGPQPRTNSNRSTRVN